MIDNKVFRDISYGLYIVSTKYGIWIVILSKQICGKLFKNTWQINKNSVKYISITK